MNHGSRRLFGGVTVLGTLVIALALWTQQPVFAPSDHGCDLYAGWAVSHGLRPYRDFQWYYGPLGPYLVAAGYQVFGTTIAGARGMSVLLLAAGSWMAYGLLARLVAPVSACLGALLVFYWGLPFHTFAYSGYLPCLAAGLLTLWRRLDGTKAGQGPGWLAAAGLAFAGAGGFKLSMGAAALLAAAAVLLMRERRVGPVLTMSAAWAAGTLLLYVPFVVGVPLHRLESCFPYFHDPFTRVSPRPLFLLWDLVVKRATAGELLTFREALQRVWTVPLLLVVSLAAGLPGIVKGFARPSGLNPRDWCLASCWWMGLFLAHEFWVVGAFWSLFQTCVLPMVILLLARMADVGARLGIAERVRLGNAGRPVGVTAAAVFCAWIVWTGRPSPSWFMSHPRGRVYINSYTVAEVSRQVTEFLDAHLSPGEPLAVFPSAPLYWYLAARPNAVWAVNFFAYRPLGPAVEREVIRDLERRRVRCVLLSNRAESVEPGVGGFGRLFNRDLWRYLREQYQPVRMVGLGPWSPATDWAVNHQMLILWRRGERFPSPPIPWP